MKTLSLFLIGIFISFLGISQNPVIHNIDVDGCSFDPPSLNVSLGDTLMWTLVVPNTRTTSSMTVPPGASPWDATLTTASNTFKYVVTTPGDYFYHSDILPTCIASITVSESVGMTEISSGNKTKAYPNPVKDKLTVIYPKHAKILTLYDGNGHFVREFALDQSQTNITVDVTDLALGMYIYSVSSSNGVIDTKRIIRIQ